MVSIFCTGALNLPEASAQIDPGLYGIEQNGKKVGVIYAPPRTAGAQAYAEHWVLFSNYVYPDGKSRVETVIKTESGASFSDEKEFMSRYTIPAGGKYIRVDSTEFSKFPVNKTK